MPDRPNVVIIMSDMHRADSLSCYGNPVVETPHLDALARDGVRFTHAFAQAASCVPSRASIWTGRYVCAHRQKNHETELPSDEVTLPMMLGAAGYRCEVAGKTHFLPPERLQGFHDRVLVDDKAQVEDGAYKAYLEGIGLLDEYRGHVKRCMEHFGAGPFPFAPEHWAENFIARKACERLRTIEGPYLYCVSFVSPHFPYDPPAPFDTMYDDAPVDPMPSAPDEIDTKPFFHRSFVEHFARGGHDFRTMSEDLKRRIIRLYYGMVSAVDACVGRAIDTLKARGDYDNTVVIYLTDHGTNLSDHGIVWINDVLWDTQTHIPMILRFPSRIPPGKVSDDMVMTVDLVPTILELAGIETPGRVQGEGLVDLAGGRAAAWRDFAFAEAEGYPPYGVPPITVRMFRTHDWKLVHYEGSSCGELYHIARDPAELVNLYDSDEHAGMRRQLQARLDEHLATLGP